MSRMIFLLPAWPVFGRQSLSPALAKVFGRADALAHVESGRDAQLMRHFVPMPARWAPAAMTRQVDAGDAAGAAWLRADPAHVRPDINGARLLAGWGSPRRLLRIATIATSGGRRQPGFALASIPTRKADRKSVG